MSEESEKAATILAKIKAKQWKEMGKTVEGLKDFTESGGIVSFADSLTEAFNLQVEDFLSPLKNEIMDKLGEALEPIMPFVTTALNEALDQLIFGMDGIEAYLTGNFDTWLADETVKFQAGIDLWPEEIKKIHLEIQKVRHAWDKSLAQIVRDWENFWKDPLGSFRQLNTDYNEWAAGVGQDIGAMWSGFWRETGLF